MFDEGILDQGEIGGVNFIWDECNLIDLFE